MMDDYELTQVSTNEEWRDYHDIRRTVLFEEKGRYNVYDPTHADEYIENNHPLLLKFNGQAIGTTRLDNNKDGTGIVRLVAIRAEARGQGHGKALSDLTKNFAKGLGIHTLYVNAAAEAVGYYKICGWTEHLWDAEELAGIAEDCTQMKITL
jgi:N-acetylglutamate synthase-like GNAT family acetyltransferase